MARGGLGNWISWNEKKKKKGKHGGESPLIYGEVLSWERKGWDGKWQVWSGGGEERPKRAGVTCVVDGCDNGVGGGQEKSWGWSFFFLFPFIFCLESAASVWTAGRADRCGFLQPLYSPPSLTTAVMVRWTNGREEEQRVKQDEIMEEGKSEQESNGLQTCSTGLKPASVTALYF